MRGAGRTSVRREGVGQGGAPACRRAHSYRLPIGRDKTPATWRPRAAKGKSRGHDINPMKRCPMNRWERGGAGLGDGHERAGGGAAAARRRGTARKLHGSDIDPMNRRPIAWWADGGAGVDDARDGGRTRATIGRGRAAGRKSRANDINAMNWREVGAAGVVVTAMTTPATGQRSRAIAAPGANRAAMISTL
jgi:hypothetical protein